MVPQVLFLILPFISTVFSHKCYVCGPDKEKPEEMLQLRRSFPDVKIQACSGYKQSLKDLYLIDCPQNSNGCLTKFEDDGSVLRTCAPIGIDDCKKANAVNYCYCSKEGCNTPDRRLAEPVDASQSHRGHALDFTATGRQKTPVDDEDGEGSGGSEDDWGSFYYDSYYDTAAGLDRNLGGPGVDTEPGFGPDYADMTEPPTFIEEELQEEYDRIAKLPTHKYDRQPVIENEIILVEETVPVRPATTAGAGHPSTGALTLLLLLAVRWTAA